MKAPKELDRIVDKVLADYGLVHSEIERSDWNDALDKAMLACEAEQAKYIMDTLSARAVRGAIEYVMGEIRDLKRRTGNEESK